VSTISPYPWAPGFYPSDRPQIVTSRFQYEDAHTLDRYHATGGYQGLRKALEQTPAEVSEEVKKSTLRRRGFPGRHQVELHAARRLAPISRGQR
jgi:NADH-quinone oxidoreductase subunit F